jgi:1,2-diacylglycerol 3-alpha-glucosyltransferase
VIDSEAIARATPPRRSDTIDSIAILWAQYGPYHFPRASALRQLAAPVQVHAMELASRTIDYAWRRTPGFTGLMTLCPDSVVEELSFRAAFLRTRQELKRLGVRVCFLPSYAPKTSLAALLAAKSLGVKALMMNESHGGTARASGVAAFVKRRLIALFDAALVGGTPHKRYFASMGLPAERIFTGYDAVDNEYFARKAQEIRCQWSVVSGQYDLPEHYFLSLGRFVAKKNLDTLIRAYALFLESHLPSHISDLQIPHLVMVGSGEEEPALRALCTELQLPIYDHAKGDHGPRTTDHRPQTTDHAARSAFRNPQSAIRNPGVHFYGFRQIDQNPVFYAFADAFILPSLYEEWGLVVNEAMASGLPVAVSETAGCAEDLLETGCPAGASPEDRMRIEQSGLALKVRRNGFLFNPRSAEELSRALLVFESSANLRALMGAESRRIVERFSCENFARNAMRAVEAALGKGARVLPAAAAMKLG